MSEIDFHGVTLEEAINRVHILVGEARVLGTSGEYRFITGHGTIKKELVKVLESYKIEAREELGNSGVIRAYLE